MRCFRRLRSPVLLRFAATWRPSVLQELDDPPVDPTELAKLAESAHFRKWNCSTCTQSFTERVRVRNDPQTDLGCPHCLRGNLLVNSYPEIAAEWDTERNNHRTSLQRHNAPSCSEAEVWWNCGSCRDSFIARIIDRVSRTVSCPRCTAMKGTPLKSTTIGQPLRETAYFRDCLATNKDTLDTDSFQVCDWLCRSCGGTFAMAVAYRVHRAHASCPQCQPDALRTQSNFCMVCKRQYKEKPLHSLHSSTGCPFCYHSKVIERRDNPTRQPEHFAERRIKGSRTIRNYLEP